MSAPRSPDSGLHALDEVSDLLRRFRLEDGLVHREQLPVAEDRRGLVETLVHRQHQATLANRIALMHAADVAYVLEALPPEERAMVWSLVAEPQQGDVLVELAESVRPSIIELCSREALIRVALLLEPDELAAIADDFPVGVLERVQQGLSTEEREQLRAAMSYPEDSVGAWMDFEMITIRDDVTLEVVLRYLRRFEALPDHTDQIFVVDRTERLRGVLPLDQLLIHEPERRVSDVMRSDAISLRAREPVEDAAQAFERYDLVSAPVLDEMGRLVGRLVVSEVVDVIRDQSDAKALSQAGLQDDEDLFASVWASARNRWLWLGVNLFTAFVASRVIGAFEGTIERVVALAALMPVVAGIAGNSGNQTMTIITRSLALNQVNRNTLGRLFAKELAVATLNGVVWGSLAGAFVWLLYLDTSQAGLLAFTMMLAILLNLLIAALIGLLVPLGLERMGRDPAMGASVLLTFTTDSLGFLIFLGLASIFFGMF